MSLHERTVDAKEIVHKMQALPQLKPLVNTLANNSNCFTSTGRINVSATARVMGVTDASVSKLLHFAKEQAPTWFGDK